jgi:hypothetical protein
MTGTLFRGRVFHVTLLLLLGATGICFGQTPEELYYEASSLIGVEFGTPLENMIRVKPHVQQMSQNLYAVRGYIYLDTGEYVSSQADYYIDAALGLYAVVIVFESQNFQILNTIYEDNVASISRTYGNGYTLIDVDVKGVSWITPYGEETGIAYFQNSWNNRMVQFRLYSQIPAHRGLLGR